MSLGRLTGFVSGLELVNGSVVLLGTNWTLGQGASLRVLHLSVFKMGTVM